MSSESSGRILGQAEVATATDWTILYAVPDARQAEVVVMICNRSGVARTGSIRIRPNGDAAADKHVVEWELPLPNGNSITTAQISITENDVIDGQASGADVNMMVTGSESEL